MEITRLSDPDFPAISDAEIETWLRIDPGFDPSAISLLIVSATEYVEGLTGLALGSARYRIELDGIDDAYRIPLHPIQSIQGVTYRGADGLDVPITDYHIANGWLYLTNRPCGFPIVELTAGYGDPVSVPAALRQAIALMVSAGYNNREELTDQTIKTVQRLCQRYKRFGFTV